MENCEAKLTLSNPNTYDNYEYRITGIVEEPIAADHLFIQCQAKKTTTKLIPVFNKSSFPVTYTIETDLINPDGANSIFVPANK